MRKIKLLLVMVIMLGWFSCNDSKEYSYSIVDHEIHLYIPRPSVGISGVGKISYGNRDFRLRDIDKDIYNEFAGIRGKFPGRQGSYDIYITWVYSDEYGRDQYEDKGKIGTIDSDEVKKYVDANRFQHSKTSVSGMIDLVTKKWMEDMGRNAAKRQLGID